MSVLFLQKVPPRIMPEKPNFTIDLNKMEEHGIQPKAATSPSKQHKSVFKKEFDWFQSSKNGSMASLKGTHVYTLTHHTLTHYTLTHHTHTKDKNQKNIGSCTSMYTGTVPPPPPPKSSDHSIATHQNLKSGNIPTPQISSMARLSPPPLPPPTPPMITISKPLSLQDQIKGKIRKTSQVESGSMSISNPTPNPRLSGMLLFSS
jgi:hypothetical protein